MDKIFLLDDDDPIDIRHDNVFKSVFTRNNPASQGALSRLVSALIGRDISIITIAANDRSGVLGDIFSVLDGQEQTPENK